VKTIPESRKIHPVLSRELTLFCEFLRGATLEELQVIPGVSAQYWCGQQVVEHLLMTLERSRVELALRIEQRRLKMKKRTLLQAVIKSHLFWLHNMPRGILTPRSLRPEEWTPMSGTELADRLLDMAKIVDDLLAVCRRVYGMEPCGEHWMYGPLRVEDWRAYTSIHIRHHLKQLKVAVDYARNPPPEPEQVTPFPRKVLRNGKIKYN
jgi:hypothetical protein